MCQGLTWLPFWSESSVQRCRALTPVDKVGIWGLEDLACPKVSEPVLGRASFVHTQILDSLLSPAPHVVSVPHSTCGSSAAQH